MRLILSLLLMLFCSTVYANTRDGLIGWWSFDEPTGTSAFDSSWNGNVGTATSTTILNNCVRSNCRSFNGSSSKVTFGNPGVNPNTSSLSVSVWVNPTSYAVQGGANPRVVSQNIDNNNVFQICLSDLGGVNSAYTAVIYQAGTEHSVASPTGYTAGIWHHVVLTYAAGTTKIYVDGALPSQSSTSGFGKGTADNVLWVGARSDSLGFVTGSIDDVRLYNRALTAQEILDLYNLGISIKGTGTKLNY